MRKKILQRNPINVVSVAELCNSGSVYTRVNIYCVTGLLMPVHITYIFDDLKKMHTIGKNAYYRKNYYKGFGKILIYLHSITQDYFFLEKQNLASISNLLKNYDVFLLCLYMQIHKQPMSLDYKVTLLDFVLLFNHRK